MFPPPTYDSLLIKIDNFSDFKLVQISTDGRIERYLRETNFPVTHIRTFLFFILASIPIFIIGNFYLNHPSVDYFNSRATEELKFQRLILDSELQGKKLIELRSDQ